MCFLVLLNNKEPVSNKGQDEQPPEQVAQPQAENSATAPSSKANDTLEERAEAKKNKRERKEERQQKNRKKEKKELKLENHQENSKSQKPKKRKKEPEAEGEEALEAPGCAGKKSRKKRSKAERAQEADGATEDQERTAETGPGKRKRKDLEGLWLACAWGFEFGVYRKSGRLSSLTQASQGA